MKLIVQHLLILLILAATSKADEATRCYQCLGYDSRQPVSLKQNNPECPTGSFNNSAIRTTPFRSHAVCYKVDYVKDGVEMTARGVTVNMETGCKEGSTKIPGFRVEGHICGCTGDLCNTAESSLIALPLLSAMLVIASLLA